MAAHELTHHLQVMAPAEYETYRGAAVSWYVDQYGAEGLTELTERYRKLGQENGAAMDEEGALDEMAADFTEKLLDDADLFGRLTQESPTMAQKLLDALREFIARVRATLTGKSRDAAAQNAYGRSFSELEQIAQKWQAAYQAAAQVQRANTAAETGSGVRYSIRNDVYRELDRWNRDGRPEGYSFTLGNTGAVLQGLGAIENDIYIEGDKINKILVDHPEMTLDEIKKIPQILEDPALALKSRTRPNSIVAFGTYRAQNRKPILAAMNLMPTENGITIDDMQKVSSAYTKTAGKGQTAEETGRAFLQNSDVLYLDEKRAASVLRPMGYYTPISILRNGYMGSIHHYGNKVKIEGVPFSEVISDTGGNVNRKFSLKGTPTVDSTGRELSPQQQEYFKDSKVRDAEGRLKKLYHQTEGGFTVFDPNNAGAGRSDGETPFGIFLKSSSRDIGLRGKTQMELYANITNPLYAENREDLSWKMELLSPEYARIKQEHRALDAEYGAKVEAAKQEWVSFITEWRKSNPDASGSALYDVPEFNRLFDAEGSIIQEWTERADVLSTQAKETITAAMREAGYDGVILKNDKGSFGRSTDAFIALDPAQVKNVDNIAPTDNADIRYSLKGSKDREVLSIKQQIAGASEQLNRAEPVAVKNVTPLLGRMSIKQKRAWAEQEIKKAGSQIDRQGYGKIYVDAEDINSALNYLQGDGEIAAFSAVPAVLKRGDEIFRDRNHKGRGYDTVTFAAPVILNGSRGNMAVVVRETGRNRYDMHRIVMPNGSAFEFLDKANAVPTTVGGITENAKFSGEVAPTINTASALTIRSNGGDVNKKFSLKGSRDYEQELRENGERNRNAYWQTPPESVPVTREESAQRMAEERARRARVEEERKAIPKTLETVGVAPFGSEADYAGAETLARQAGGRPNTIWGVMPAGRFTPRTRRCPSWKCTRRWR